VAFRIGALAGVSCLILRGRDVGRNASAQEQIRGSPGGPVPARLPNYGSWRSSRTPRPRCSASAATSAHRTGPNQHAWLKCSSASGRTACQPRPGTSTPLGVAAPRNLPAGGVGVACCRLAVGTWSAAARAGKVHRRWWPRGPGRSAQHSGMPPHRQGLGPCGQAETLLDWANDRPVAAARHQQANRAPGTGGARPAPSPGRPACPPQDGASGADLADPLVAEVPACGRAARGDRHDAAQRRGSSLGRECGGRGHLCRGVVAAVAVGS